ncbi:Photosystem I reaction center subunit VI, chloroplastic [Tetrabaena socialis]|uniref:Photosystem I reaction center subunit VI, chloroplastic n=1 Tax=Tetrabaena socialis TaxID=47790 RepID=A0A2J7ZLM7_9CHLO|nr:Photosystem I reaction center subunit VI, chloroplastic [Tetrabaena socialis]|eukprot:PNH01167.1 Photosystem I reaction center subunit VI, chloroplastic [Tetrabaena socialis]
MASMVQRPVLGGRVAAQRPRVSARKAVTVRAKYGEQSRYFDLQDLENTTGAWDMYGVDDKKRYPDNQAKFFTQATEILSRREALRAFVALSGVAAIATFGLKGAKDASLPITKGPQTTGESGKGGALRSRL